MKRETKRLLGLGLSLVMVGFITGAFAGLSGYLVLNTVF